MQPMVPVTNMNSTSEAPTLTITSTAITSDINHIGTGHSDDEDEDEEMPTSPDSSNAYEEDSDMMANAVTSDEVTAQLAAAGPVGMAAAAAIASAKKRKRPHYFETNPSIRKRQQTRLIKRLRQTLDEFTTRVGQQACVVVATPGKPAQCNFKIFGAKPLEDVLRGLSSVIMHDLEVALQQQAPPPPQEDPSRHELPPLVIEGIPTPVEKMTQAQLRAFIPLMLKFSTGRGKPGWGKETTKPPWWPKDLPWANVRMDARTEEQKQKVSWTHALRQIVINCYKYHGREDLLPSFNEEEDAKSHVPPTKQPKVSRSISSGHVTGTVQPARMTVQDASGVHYTSTVVQTISNPDGTLSIIQVDPNNPIITLPDGTTAQVQGVTTIPTSEGITIEPGEGGIASAGTVTLSTAEATINQDGQIILTGEDGQTFPVVSGMITVPVPVSMYQTVVANMQSGQMVSPFVTFPKVEPNSDSMDGGDPVIIRVTGSSQASPGESRGSEDLTGSMEAQMDTSMDMRPSKHTLGSKEPEITITRTPSSAASVLQIMPVDAVEEEDDEEGGGGSGEGVTTITVVTSTSTPHTSSSAAPTLSATTPSSSST